MSNDEWFGSTWAHGRDNAGRHTLLRRGGWAKSVEHLPWKEIATITDRDITNEDMAQIVAALNEDRASP
jgi:hypothetical protein